MARFVVGMPLILLLTSAFAQNPPKSDPKAVSFASKSIVALTGGQAIKDATLTGSVTWAGGASPETGTATLLASGTGESRMSLVLPTGTRTETRDASTGVARGQWIAQSGESGLFALDNYATDAVWFFPALSSLATGPNAVLTYVGLETRNEAAVQHIQSYVYQPSPLGVTPSPQQLSTINFYLVEVNS